MARAALKTKTKAAPAAQSRDETERHIARMGALSRDLTRCEADLGDEVAAVKERWEKRAEPLRQEMAELQDRVLRWCEANRDALTNGGRTKTAVLTTGEVSWRLRPPKVSLRGIDTIIDHLQSRLGGRFLRTKVEIDKEAILADPESVVGIPGVTIGSEGEDFIVKPFDAELAVAA